MSVSRRFRRLAAGAAIVAGLAGGLSAFGASATAVSDTASETHHGHHVDPAPRGIDVSHRPTTEELYAAETSTGGASSTSTTGVPCYGDGASGKRVQAVYLVASDVTDRYADVVDLIRGYAANVDDIYADSAAETGGVRHIRWVTNGSCQLAVDRVVVSSTADDSLSATIAALQSKGYNRSDRKYLVWADAASYCGMSEMRADDRPTVDNANNAGNMFARIDAACWGSAASVEAHELMHILGGVQASAPHGTGNGHCTDDYDRMCYADGAGVTVTTVCSAHERLFDCNHDDYFHTAPATGTYLATHWNTAMSAFLERVEPGTATPPPPVEDPAPTTTTDTFTGTLSRKATTASYTATTSASGTVSSTLTFSARKASLTLVVYTATGTEVGRSSGAGTFTLDRSLPAGSYRFVVSGTTGVGFTLAVTHS